MNTLIPDLLVLVDKLFVNENIDAQIRRLEELRGNNWCLYIYDESYVNKEGFIRRVENVTKEVIKNNLVEHIRSWICAEYTIESFCDEFEFGGLLPPRNKVEASIDFIMQHLTIEDHKDYCIDYGVGNIVISCHSQYIKTLLSNQFDDQ